MDNGHSQTEALWQVEGAFQSQGLYIPEVTVPADDLCEIEGMCGIVEGPVKKSIESPACRLIKERQRWAQAQDEGDQAPAEIAVEALQQLISIVQTDVTSAAPEPLWQPSFDASPTDLWLESPRHLMLRVQERTMLESLWKTQVQKTHLAGSLGARVAQLSVRDVRLGSH